MQLILMTFSKTLLKSKKLLICLNILFADLNCISCIRVPDSQVSRKCIAGQLFNWSFENSFGFFIMKVKNSFFQSLFISNNLSYIYTSDFAFHF
jgi:hypothetical protein